MNDIIEGAKQGNAECFEKIYDMYKNCIYYFCTKLIESDSERAAELCCESFACAFERMDTLPSADRFELWIKNIAAIKCYNYVHKMKPMLFLQEVGDTSEPLFTTAEIAEMEKGNYDKTAAASVMDKMLNKLNDAQRMTIMLHYYNGLSMPQIAKIMSCDEDIVRQRMTKAAEHMKTTVSVLSENEIVLESVDFRSVLQLMAACITVPQRVTDRVRSVIAQLAVGQAEQQPQSDEEYVIERYVTNAETEVGALEEATKKYAADTPAVKYDLSNFAQNSQTVAEETVSQLQQSDMSERKKAPRKAKKSSGGFFKKFNSTQQAVALLLVVVLLVTVLLCAVLPKKKTNPDLAVSSTPSVTSSTAAASSEKVVIPVYSLTFKTETAAVTAEDGAEVAIAKYDVPTAVISVSQEAQDAVNSFFTSDKEKVLATYSSQKKQQECLYMYSTKNYGAWKCNQNVVAMQAGRVDKTSVSLTKTQTSYTYGNAHEETEQEGYCFSSQNGKQLKLADIMSDRNGYIEYAAEKIAKAAEEKQNKGTYALYDDYAETIKKILKKDGRWYLTDNGITVIFNPDEIVYYTYGVQTFELPYSEINNYLNVDYQK